MSPARDPLRALLRLQLKGVDEARQRLAGCLSREIAADAAITAAAAAIAHETAVAHGSAGDLEVEAFARWLPQGRHRLVTAEIAGASAAHETALARAALTLARGAAEATEDLLEQRQRQRREAADRAEQLALDEVALRSSPDPRPAS